MTDHDEYMLLCRTSQEACRITDRTYAVIGRLYAKNEAVPASLVRLAAEREQVWMQASTAAEDFYCSHFPGEGGR